jgi:hypothetical protein
MIIQLNILLCRFILQWNVLLRNIRLCTQYKHLIRPGIYSDQTLRITNLENEIRDSECLVGWNAW